MWLNIAKGVLLLFVAGGTLFYVVSIVRKQRAVGRNKYTNPYIADRSAPPLQPPEWVNWTDDGDAETSGDTER
jgi:hypothetical protein